mmetsp:Transcript_70367/g.198568  ORF Transcript_70367/g.198568 Transcript_70367/m.198568 type:complete len:227 (+) Transcript_70367:108-788(+)
MWPMIADSAPDAGGSSSEHHALQLVCGDAREEAYEGQAADALAVPQEAHALHAHERHASDAADAEDRPARAGGERDELPQRGVGLGLPKHVDGALDQGHVVHEGGGDAQQGAERDGVVADHLHEVLPVSVEDAGRVQRPDGEEHAREEEETREVDLVKGGDDALVLRRVLRLRLAVPCSPCRLALVAERVGEQPHHAEGEEHAQVRRHATHHLQDRDHQYGAEAHR